MSSTASPPAPLPWAGLARLYGWGHQYGVAILLSGAAFLARWMIGNALGERVPFTLFLIPVVVSAWYGGLGPGLVSTVLCLLIADYSIQRPFALLMSRDTADLVRLLSFLVVGCLVSTVSQQLHSALREARHQTLAAARATAELAAKAVMLEAQRAEVEEARQSAETANLAKGRFLAAISHDLRTPLNAIIGYAELIEMEVRGPVTAPQREDLRRIRRGAEHLLAMIRDILHFAKAEAGQLQLHLEEVPVDPFMAELEALITPQADARGIRYERASTTGPSPRVMADADRLRQIMLNLLSNAIKFTEPGGSVRVSCEAAAGEVRVRVTDSGCGISAESLATIFEPFVQVEGPSAREGVGLGLAISRDLARRMGGEVEVESRVGEGSTFTLRLPRAA